MIRRWTARPAVGRTREAIPVALLVGGGEKGSQTEVGLRRVDDGPRELADVPGLPGLLAIQLGDIHRHCTSVEWNMCQSVTCSFTLSLLSKRYEIIPHL